MRKSEIFDRINDGHIALGHVGGDKPVAEPGKKYFNIPCKVIDVYFQHAQNVKNTQPTAEGGCWPILTEDFKVRAKENLICYESEKR